MKLIGKNILSAIALLGLIAFAQTSRAADTNGQTTVDQPQIYMINADTQEVVRVNATGEVMSVTPAEMQILQLAQSNQLAVNAQTSAANNMLYRHHGVRGGIHFGPIGGGIHFGRGGIGAGAHVGPFRGGFHIGNGFWHRGHWHRHHWHRRHGRWAGHWYQLAL